MRKQLFINGAWRDSASGATLEVVNPATEDVVATVASAEQSDVDAAVAAARAALDGPWGKMSARERGRLIWQIGEKLMEKADEIARLETMHNGKPIFESRQVELPAAAECFQYFAGWADKIHGETIPVKGNFLTYTLREPVGVVAAIVPWNFPLLLTSWKVAPALACGNTVIIKPASQTPLTALALAEIAQEIGIPPGVINVITGPGAKVGQMLVEHPGIDKIAFTGDTSTGKQIMRGSAETLKHITLELGGKSPNIVFADADIEAAVRGATTRHLLRQRRSLRGRIATARRCGDQRRVHRQGRGAGEEDGGGRSARSQDAARRHLVEEAARQRLALHRDRQERRRDARRRRIARRTSAPARATFCSRRCSPASRRR